MPASEIVDHYRSLINEHQWLLSDGFCWTVIGSTGADFTEGLAPGALPEVRELDVREDPLNLLPIPVVFIREHNEVLSLVQTEGTYVGRPEVLRRLARGGWVWSVSWGPRDGGTISYARDGKLRWPEFSYDGGILQQAEEGVDAGFAQHLALLSEVRHSDDHALVRAAALAVIDAATGARLDADWLNGSAQAIVVDFPLPADAPLLTPFSDRELDVLLRARPQSARREILLTAAETIAEEFDLVDLTGALGAVRQAGELTPDAQDALLFTQIDLCGEWQENPVEGRARMLAGTAIRAALRAMTEGADNFDALVYARASLGPRWPALEAEIHRIAEL